MRKILYGAIALLLAAQAYPQVAATDDREIARQVYDDAKVIRRIADVAKRDLPRNVLGEIIEEDLETLRGKTAEYEYRYAAYTRTEADRHEERFSFTTDKEEPKSSSFDLKGTLAYRFRLQVPPRRMLLLNNRRVWVERVDVSYVPIGRESSVTESFDVKAWLEPGDERLIEVPQIAREATATVWASTEPGEKASLDVAVYRATLVDNPDSPFATVVRRVNVLDDAVDERDYRKLRNVADEVLALLETRAGAGAATRFAAVPATPAPARTDDDIYFELREIHVRLSGDEASRKEAIQRLERLLERLRP
jgi:hypothetical protein